MGLKMPYKNPEMHRLACEKYRKSHREQIRQHYKEYRRLNKGIVLARQKVYRDSNKEKISISGRQYRKTPKGRLSRILHQVRNRDKSCNLNINYVMNLYMLQQGKCAISGAKMVTSGYASSCEARITSKGAPVLDSISIDRKNPKKGYIKGNVRLVTFQANVAKHLGTDAQLLKFCKAVVKHAKKK